MQEENTITVEDIRAGVNKEGNWKAGDPDLVQEFWCKETVSIVL